jgi:phosphate/phosphite/phosphonate ABC transporter binding protein
MFVLLALALAAQPASPAAGSDDLLLKVGELAPPFSMRALDKKPFSLADYVGDTAREPKKAVFIAFFATWCEPCKKEIPIVKALYKKWKPRGVEVVYVGLSQGAKDLEPFAQQVGFEWPVVPDAFGLLGRRYGASQLPHLFIVDAQGVLAYQHRGIAPDLAKELDAQLARVTGEAAGPAVAATSTVEERFSTRLVLARAPSAEASTGRWQPLAAYVGELAAANIELATDPSYDLFMTSLKAGKYDIVNAGPLICHTASDLYEPVVRLERQGVPTYQGILFVPRASKITSVAGLKGKRIGLFAESSTSGGLFQKLALITAGLDPMKDVTIVWLGSHEKVAIAVKNGEVDAGGCLEDCRDFAWPEPKAKAAATRIVGYTAPIPGEMVMVRKTLDPKTKTAIQKALVSLTDNAGLLSAISANELPVTAFVAAGARDLVAIEDAIKKVGKR